MLGYICLGTLAAFGLLSGLWALFGWLLPGSRGSALLFLCRPGKDVSWVLARYRWLRDLGLIRGPLLIIGSSLSPQEQERIRQRHRDVEFWNPEELSSRLEQEWKQLG